MNIPMLHVDKQTQTIHLCCAYILCNADLARFAQLQMIINETMSTHRETVSQILANIRWNSWICFDNSLFCEMFGKICLTVFLWEGIELDVMVLSFKAWIHWQLKHVHIVNIVDLQVWCRWMRVHSPFDSLDKCSIFFPENTCKKHHSKIYGSRWMLPIFICVQRGWTPFPSFVHIERDKANTKNAYGVLHHQRQQRKCTKKLAIQKQNGKQKNENMAIAGSVI